jgi:hypothetical protein
VLLRGNPFLAEMFSECDGLPPTKVRSMGPNAIGLAKPCDGGWVVQYNDNWAGAGRGSDASRLLDRRSRY